MKALRFTPVAAAVLAFATVSFAQDEAVVAAPAAAPAPQIFKAPDRVGSSALAESNFAYGGLGIFQFGSKLANETLGTGFALEAGANINVMPQLDIVGGLRYLSVGKNGFTFSRLDLGGDAAFYFMPKQEVNPFAGGGLFLANFTVEYKYDYGWGVSGKTDDSETKIGLKLFGGAEFDIAPELWLRAALVFEFVSDYNDVALQLIGGFSVTEQLIPYAKFEYWTDEGDIVFILGAAFKF